MWQKGCCGVTLALALASTGVAVRMCRSVLAMKDKMSELAKKLGLPANADFGKL